MCGTGYDLAVLHKFMKKMIQKILFVQIYLRNVKLLRRASGELLEVSSCLGGLKKPCAMALTI